MKFSLTRYVVFDVDVVVAVAVVVVAFVDDAMYIALVLHFISFYFDYSLLKPVNCKALSH